MRSPQPARLRPQERILAECLRLIGRQLRRSCFVTMPAALVLAVGLNGHVNFTMLVLWVGLVLGATALLVYVAGFEMRLDTSAAIANRRNEVVMVALLLGLSWGSAPLIIFPADGAHQILLAGTLVGVLGGISFGTLLLRPAFAALCTPIVSVLLARLALQGDTLHMAAAGSVAVATIALLVHALELSSTSTMLVRNRIEAELLAKRLAKAQELIAVRDGEIDRLFREMGDHQDRDELTGAFNRRHIMEQVSTHCRNAAQGYDPFTFVVLTIDGFDRIVELHGQAVGDELVRKVAAILQASLRTDDYLARLTGAEFAMVLNNALTDGAMICVELIRRKLASTPIDAGEPILVTSSIGLITWRPGISPRAMLLNADTALKTAHLTGKNRISVWGDEARGSSILSM